VAIDAVLAEVAEGYADYVIGSAVERSWRLGSLKHRLALAGVS
jgi:hypothetical protein